MSKWTPGPWTWGDKFRGLFGSGENNEVLTYYHYEGMHLIAGNTEANARLIAAAPDLLEALKAMTDRWEPDTTGADRRMWEAACAAIAKAEGA